jgi:hypothetical protein
MKWVYYIICRERERERKKIGIIFVLKKDLISSFYSSFFFFLNRRSLNLLLCNKKFKKVNKFFRGKSIKIKI